jgi:hypothetical protein
LDGPALISRHLGLQELRHIPSEGVGELRALKTSDADFLVKLWLHGEAPKVQLATHLGDAEA